MLKGESEILVDIFLNKRTYKQITTSLLARHCPYIISNVGTLKKKGYIVEQQTGGYAITDKGIRALGEYYSDACLSTQMFLPG